MTTTDQPTTPSAPSTQPRVAIVGSGIAGLSAAYHLADSAALTVFEANDYFGGHTHTVDVTLDTANGPKTWGIDTGFLVLNERTYPRLLGLFKELNIPLAESDMSFSVQVPNARGDGRALEWSGTSLPAVFSQTSNLWSLDFWRMLRDVLRFNKIATGIARQQAQSGGLSDATSLRDFLEVHAFSTPFRDWYLLPMLGSIWSCPTPQMLAFPIGTLVQFCDNHGLLQIVNRPKWFTVAGGARQYVDTIIATLADARLNTPVTHIARHPHGVTITTATGTETFDAVVLACHSDQALQLLSAPSASESTVLGAIQFQDNVAVLHTDPQVLPQEQRAWSAWNYERAPESAQEDARVCLHYLINHLQPLPFTQPVVVSLNPINPIDPAQILGQYDYAHPVFDKAAIAAQKEIAQLQGQNRTFFCGAWCGYGFHEDGLKAGIRAAALVKSALVNGFPTADGPPAGDLDG